MVEWLLSSQNRNDAPYLGKIMVKETYRKTLLSFEKKDQMLKKNQPHKFIYYI